jgi:hypothetical protein
MVLPKTQLEATAKVVRERSVRRFCAKALANVPGDCQFRIASRVRWVPGSVRSQFSGFAEQAVQWRRLMNCIRVGAPCLRFGKQEGSE